MVKITLYENASPDLPAGKARGAKLSKRFANRKIHQIDSNLVGQ
jgi:hypothetical protein